MDNAIISGGCIITQAEISNSVLSQRVCVEKGAVVRESVLMARVTIGEGAKVQRAIIDKNVEVPPLTQIGFSKELDEARGFKVSEGITVVPKGYVGVSRILCKWHFRVSEVLQSFFVARFSGGA